MAWKAAKGGTLRRGLEMDSEGIRLVRVEINLSLPQGRDPDPKIREASQKRPQEPTPH
jgi:hypothetical protein